MTLIVANWKMHGSITLANELCGIASAALTHPKYPHQCVICPPFTLLGQVNSLIAKSKISLGAQTCHSEPSGAFTGNISAKMLKEAGCSYVILGHSERRIQHGETSVVVAAQAVQAHNEGLNTIICIGESETEYRSKKTLEVLKQQLLASLPKTATYKNTIIAYEPVWAIGSGLTPSAKEIADCHSHIASVLNAVFSRKHEVLYGGSVSSSNCREIFSITGVSGVLVGSASVNPQEFKKILTGIH